MATFIGIVLTLNEESNVEKCIRSLSWCDDIYVIDSGSTDNTVGTARSNGAKVLVNKQEERFSIVTQRNWALRHIPEEAEYYIFLDADERCSDEFIEEVRNKCVSGPLVDLYYCCPKYIFMNKWLRYTQKYPVWHPRIVNKRLKNSNPFVGDVWEEFGSYGEKSFIHCPYLHLAESGDIDKWLVKHIFYAGVEARKILLSHRSNRTEQVWIRKRKRRRILSVIWLIRPFVIVVERLIYKGGWRDGSIGLFYIFLLFWYELTIVTILISEKLKSRK